MDFCYFCAALLEAGADGSGTGVLEPVLGIPKGSSSGRMCWDLWESLFLEI